MMGVVIELQWIWVSRVMAFTVTRSVSTTIIKTSKNKNVLEEHASNKLSETWIKTLKGILKLICGLTKYVW